MKSLYFSKKLLLGLLLCVNYTMISHQLQAAHATCQEHRKLLTIQTFIVNTLTSLPSSRIRKQEDNNEQTNPFDMHRLYAANDANLRGLHSGRLVDELEVQAARTACKD
jgi:hypothetical protein